MCSDLWDLKQHSVCPLTWRGKGDFHAIISLCRPLFGDIHPCARPGSINSKTIASPLSHANSASKWMANNIQQQLVWQWQLTTSLASDLLALLHFLPPVFQRLCLPIVRPLSGCLVSGASDRSWPPAFSGAAQMHLKLPPPQHVAAGHRTGQQQRLQTKLKIWPSDRKA